MLRLIQLSENMQQYNDRLPFTCEQLSAHRSSIAPYGQASGVRVAIENEELLARLRQPG
jgi:hypothetical protein